MATLLTMWRELAWQSALLTVLIEGITIFARYGLRLESTRDTAATIGWLTGGIRIHHGYVGLLLLVAAFVLLWQRPLLFRWAFVVGTALVASDLIHHFGVLWPVEGDPQFDLVYPDN